MPQRTVSGMVGRILHGCAEPEDWTYTGKPRVLVEGPDSWAWRPRLTAAGFEVATCRGPSPYEQCPLLISGVCATAAAADTIVCDLPLADRANVVEALAESYPLTRVVRSAHELLR
jgi:hypothetical protein